MEQAYRPDKDMRDATVIKSGTTTSAGNVGGTTLIDSSLTQGTNYWINMAVLILSGNSIGQIRRISAFTTASGTITVDTAFATQIASGTKYNILGQYAITSGSGDATLANQTLMLADIGDASTSTLGSLYAILGNPAVATTTYHVKEVSITSAANAGDVTVATVTTQPCIIDSIIIHADAAQTADMTTCAITGGASKVITFISTNDATQANLNAADKQVAWVGAVRLAATKTIVISLPGTGATAVDLTISITYHAAVSGGYLT